MSRAIDLMHLGHDRVICAYDIGGVIVDPGPASCLETLLEACEPRALCLTHIHLDHAGATGTLVERFPDIPVYVHQRGAEHLLDPTRLLKSARQLYGDDMERLWGEVLAVPQANIHPLEGGETVAGLQVAYTPGHASHHVCYLHVDTGEAFVGDTAGVRIPPFDYVVPPTPPPDIDLEQWQRSLDILEQWAPNELSLTHFGTVTEVDGHIQRLRAQIDAVGEKARSDQNDGRDFVSRLETEIRDQTDPDVAPRLCQAAPPKQLWLGLERYWRKRAEREEVRS